MLKLARILFLICLIVRPFPAHTAENITVPENTSPLSIIQIGTRLDNITKQLTIKKATKEQSLALWQEVAPLQEQLKRDEQALQLDLISLQKKIATLGDAPEKANDEPAEIAQQRKHFNKQADSLKTQMMQIDLLQAKIEDINTLMLKLRNQQLLDNILVKQSSIFQPQEFWQSLISFAVFSFDLIKSPILWYQSISAGQRSEVNAKIFGVLFTMLLSLIGAYFLKIYLYKNYGYIAATEHPDYSQKLRAGIVLFAARGLIPAAIIGVFLIWLRHNELINKDAFGLLLKTAAWYLLFYYLSKALIKVLFTPENSKWRLIEITDERATNVSSALIISVALIAIVSFFQSLAAQLEYDNSIIYSLKIFANAVKAFCIILVARRALYDDVSLEDSEIVDDSQIIGLSNSSKISLLLSLSAFSTFAISLLGYIRLSEYILNRTIYSAVVIGIFHIALQLLKGILHRFLLLRFWLKTLRINRRALVKTEIWINLFLTPIVFICACLFLLAVWGVPVDLLTARVKSFLEGFNIGGIHISISSIFLGLVSFFVVLSLFKMLKNSFISGNLSKIILDDGIKNSVVSSIHFLGFIISGILAIAVMGGSLSSIALIAGTLSFGIGLGLQSMVSNLAAGMTILWERPLKIGDWVVINGQEGIVKQINMRSTELENFDKSTLIVPNSDILAKSFINYTYNSKFGRTGFKIIVSPDNDIKLIKSLMLEATENMDDILKHPHPSVSLSNIVDGNPEFTLLCYTGNIFNRATIVNSLRERIFILFREHHITYSNPKHILISDFSESTE